MFPTKKDSDSIPVPLASFTGRDPFAHKCAMHLIGSGSVKALNMRRDSFSSRKYAMHLSGSDSIRRGEVLSE